MFKFKKRFAALFVVAICAMGAFAASAFAASIAASTPAAFNGFQDAAHGNEFGGTAASAEICIQVRQADGSFVNQSGSCTVYYNVPSGASFPTIGSYVHGHIYRSWAWASNAGAATSGWFAP